MEHAGGSGWQLSVGTEIDEIMMQQLKPDFSAHMGRS